MDNQKYDLKDWLYDDITWCGNECSNTKCFRNIIHKSEQTKYFSMALFKGTEICPLEEHKTKQ